MANDRLGKMRLFSNGQVQPAPLSHTVVRADPAALAKHWQWLHPRIKLLLAKVDHAHVRAGFREAKLRFTAEHVRMDVIRGFHGQGTTELFLCINSQGSIDGFFVTCCEPDPHAHVPYTLFLWLAWSGSPGLLEQIDPELDNLARARGCVAIEYMSPRRGWLKRNPPGWRVSQITYRREIV